MRCDEAFGTSRVTPARRAVVSAVSRMGSHSFTIEDLFRACPNNSSIGIATVYRAVAAMESAGYLERVGMRGGSTLYARCGHGHHHHHVVCDRCGRTEQAPCPIAPDVLESGFVITRHEMTLYGLCADCSRNSR